MSDIIWEILSLSEKYFSDKAISFIRRELNQIDFSHYNVYYQISQKDESPTLEIVYLKGQVINYYQFKGVMTELTLLPFRSISNHTGWFGRSISNDS